MNYAKNIILRSAEALGFISHTLFNSQASVKHVIKCHNQHIWFGYYDHMPSNGKYVLFHKAHNLTKSPNVQICTYNLASQGQKILTQSSAFSSQLATRLSWLSPSLIHFNSFESNSAVTAQYDIETGQKKSLPFHFWNFTKPNEDEIIYASMNMLRLSLFREGYGFNLPSGSNRRDDYNSNYLRFYSSKRNGTFKLICSLEHCDLLEIAKECFNASSFYLNHALFSPDSSSCVFCIYSTDSSSKDTQLVHFSLKNRTYRVLLPGFIVSHHCFLSNEELLICVIKNNRTFFIKYNLKSWSYDHALSGYAVDGHPGFENDKIILDTYPNRMGIQKLLISNSIDEYPAEFFSVHSPRRINNGPLRVDLHPRIDALNGLVWIDVMHNNYRQLWAVELPSSWV